MLKTSYLYLTKSTDGGARWSAPTMLNSQVKNSSDKFYGVGPGRGLTTRLDDGTERIIFPCYTYTNADGNTSVIYSDDGGQTWTRSNNIPDQTSEATLTEVNGKFTCLHVMVVTMYLRIMEQHGDLDRMLVELVIQPPAR